MNTHVPQEIKDKYPNIEFRGTPIEIKNRTVIKAENHATGMSFYYSFAEDFFWFRGVEMPDWFIKHK
jgi:hypothetical protein